ncbi:MAG: putative murein hydrolase (TIGR00659 family) [Paraglaciecola sp.]|jgi:predicted murein hydrolase (TIGR00659 family)
MPLDLSFVSPSALLWLGVTLVVYLTAIAVFKRLGRNPLLHPLIFCLLLLWAILEYCHVPIREYQAQVNLLHWLLGPATVALAIPLFGQLQAIKKAGSQILVPIIIGGVLAPLIAIGWVYAEPLALNIKLSLLTKSITTPLAMDTANYIGGVPELAAVIVIFTGIVGAVVCGGLFKLCAIENEQAKGIALGTVAHAIGTAQAFHISQKTGAFATLALCINGVLTAIILPLLFLWLG